LYSSSLVLSSLTFLRSARRAEARLAALRNIPRLITKSSRVPMPRKKTTDAGMSKVIAPASMVVV